MAETAKPIQDESTAVLLIAHGSRRPEANADLVELAERIAARSDFSFVEVSYLELAEPGIAQGGRKSVERGATRVLMLPYFLSAGIHVARDLEAARHQLAQEFSGVSFILCPPLGLHPLMTEIVLDRLKQGATQELAKAT